MNSLRTKTHLILFPELFPFTLFISCCCSVTKSCLTLCNPMDCSTSGSPVHHWPWSLLKFLCIESVMPSNHLILCHPLLLLPSIFLSISLFRWVSHRIRWSKYWNFSISPSNATYGQLLNPCGHNSKSEDSPWLQKDAHPSHGTDRRSEKLMIPGKTFNLWPVRVDDVLSFHVGQLWDMIYTANHQLINLELASFPYLPLFPPPTPGTT